MPVQLFQLQLILTVRDERYLGKTRWEAGLFQNQCKGQSIWIYCWIL